MTVNQFIEKLENITQHRLETEVKFWFWRDDALEEGQLSLEDVGDYIEVVVDPPNQP
jgi:hypothetical protein